MIAFTQALGSEAVAPTRVLVKRDANHAADAEVKSLAAEDPPKEAEVARDQDRGRHAKSVLCPNLDRNVTRDVLLVGLAQHVLNAKGANGIVVVHRNVDQRVLEKRTAVRKRKVVVELAIGCLDNF